MGIFGSTIDKTAINADIDQCLSTKKSVGTYRYGVRQFECEIAGEEYHQGILSRLRRVESVCEIVREPENDHDKRAIVVKVDGLEVGYIPKNCLDYMHKVFDAMGDENIRLVGTLTVGRGHEGGYMATAKIRVCRFSK